MLVLPWPALWLLTCDSACDAIEQILKLGFSLSIVLIVLKGGLGIGAFSSITSGKW
jgi:hypothetical protein